jgi:hypothetical protein
MFNFKVFEDVSIPLEGDEEDCQYLNVGCGLPPGSGSGGVSKANPPAGPNSGNYEITIADTRYFSVDPPKGTVNAGEKTRICFKYLRPADDPDNSAPEMQLLATIGQWKETTATITLSGGHVPEGAPATQTITVNLKAYLRRI